MKRKAFLLLLLATSFALGFVQENVKVNINFILDQGDRMTGFFDQTAEVKKQWLNQQKIFSPLDYYYSHSTLDVFLSVSKVWLVRLKWINTVVFTALFLVLNGAVIQLITRDVKMVRHLVLAYAVSFAAAFALYAIGIATGYALELYAVSRKLIGALQSMVPLMIFIPAWYLYTHFQNTNSR